MPETVVHVEQVSKKFCRSLKRGMLYTSADVARDMMGLSRRNTPLRVGEFWALKDVSLTLKRGECLGLIGVNGSGKSTLLKVLNGIVRPDEGCVRIGGRVGALIEVGAGFHPLLTGRENIYVNGAILGMGKREIDRKFDEIVAFSGLNEEILDAPVKTYSSGMYVRLGFSVAVHTEPDVLLVDEVLAVGDIRFIGRCRAKIREMRERGVSLILVSHNLALIEASCDRGMLLAKGQCLATGSAQAVTTAYRRYLRDTEPVRDADTDAVSSLRFISGSLFSSRGKLITGLVCGEEALLELTLSTTAEITSGYFCLWLRREEDEQITGVGYLEVGKDIGRLTSGTLWLRFRCQAMPGSYQMGVTFSADGQCNLVDEFTPCNFTVEPSPDSPFTPSGVFKLDVWSETAPDTPPQTERLLAAACVLGEMA